MGEEEKEEGEEEGGLKKERGDKRGVSFMWLFGNGWEIEERGI